jgi:hypothetical protein
MREEKPRRRLPRIQPRPITAPVPEYLHHPTADSARVSALPVPPELQDNQMTRPVTGTVSPIPHLPWDQSFGGNASSAKRQTKSFWLFRLTL